MFRCPRSKSQWYDQITFRPRMYHSIHCYLPLEILAPLSNTSAELVSKLAEWQQGLYTCVQCVF